MGLVLCRFQCTVARVSVVHIIAVQQSMVLRISSGKVAERIVVDPQRGAGESWKEGEYSETGRAFKVLRSLSRHSLVRNTVC